MASILKGFTVAVPPAHAWDAIADFGALHTRLVPGFVDGCVLEEDGVVRHITFANGLQARERLVTRDAAERRLVYTAQGGRATHYNAAVQVSEDPAGGTRIEWRVDLLPDALAPAIEGMMDAGVQAMRKALSA